MVTSWLDMCPFYKKDVFLLSNTGSLEEKNLSTSMSSQTHDLLVTD